MKLLRIYVQEAKTCGDLLNGLSIPLRAAPKDERAFDPLCIVGPNGSGKSQLLQVVAEIFQAAFHACLAREERNEGNEHLLFEIEYVIRPADEADPVHVRIARTQVGKRRVLRIERLEAGDWVDCPIAAPETHRLLPAKVIGYTSGDNETLSLPFVISRGGYASEVAARAIHGDGRDQPVPDTRLMMVDYATHLEVLVANLLLGDPSICTELLAPAGLRELDSFRCIVRLAHLPRLKSGKKQTGRKGVQLTSELEQYLAQMKQCSTCHSYDDTTETYVFDFWLHASTRQAFGHFWASALDLYSAFHKLAMLNDLAIQKVTRTRFQRMAKERRFASRLPEPQDEEKIFRFEQVCFLAKTTGNVVDYVSLSDGEHQRAQILGTLCMASFPNVLFLLDEPESHFNPKWRVKFISDLMNLPTAYGRRTADGALSRRQECLITTHAPFVPSDMAREKILIFSREDGRLRCRKPDIETYGTTFDTILDECFDVRPPISEGPRREIAHLLASRDPEEIKAGLENLGSSVEKAFVMDHLRQVAGHEVD